MKVKFIITSVFLSVICFCFGWFFVSVVICIAKCSSGYKTDTICFDKDENITWIVKSVIVTASVVVVSLLGLGIYQIVACCKSVCNKYRYLDEEVQNEGAYNDLDDVDNLSELDLNKENKEIVEV